MGGSISTSTTYVPSFEVAEKRFTEDELKAFRRGFSRLCSMDLGRCDNAVGFDVFQSVLLLDFPDLPQGLVQRLFSVLDTDKSHSINYEKLLCGLCAMCRGSLNERLSLLFAVYDVDGTGNLERARLEKIALTLSDSRSSQEDQVSSQALISSVFQVVGKDVVPASSFQGPKVQRVIATYLHAPLLSWPVMVGQSLLEPLFELDDGLAPLSPTTMYYTSPSRAPLNPYGLKASPHNEAFLSDAIAPARTREQIEEGREFLAASDFDGSDELNEGDSWFVLELAWFEHWKAYTGCEEFESGGIPDKPGPICNACLLRNDPTEAAWTYIGLDGTKEAFQPIRPDAVIDEDYVVLNEVEWRVLYGRYGADVVLRREVVVCSEGEPVLELHPKPLNVRCVALCASPVDSRSGPIGNMQPDTTLATLSSTKIGERLVQSNETSIQALRETATGNDVFQEPQHIVVSVRMSLEEMARHVICQSFIDPRGRTSSSFGHAQWDADLLFSDRARIWSVQNSLEGDMSDSSPSLRRRDIVNVQLLRDHKATVEEGELEDGQTILLELLSSEGVWPLENATTLSSMETDFHKGVSLGVEQEKSEFREGQPQLLGGAGRRNDQRNTIFRLSQKDVNGTTLDPSFSKLKDAAPPVRTIAKTGALAGTGFLNLGNTCFMNASLQCILSTRLFMQYFEQGSFVMDINKTNKFGTRGHLVDAFAELVRMYAASSKGRPINPVRFKREIGKWDRRFAGFDQQDASELLSAVLEGLSEDLNKIKAKAYTELKDSEGRADDIVAREWWENHLRRELSIITALFTGQFKSVVECEACGFQSARFEPFTYLSLPLPDSPLRSITVNIIFSDGKRPPLVCAVRVDKDSTHGAIKQAICDLGAAESEEVTSAMNNVEKRVRVTLNPARMVLAFVFDRQIQSIIPDDRPLHMLKDKESLFAFEIPEVDYAEAEVFAGPFCSVRYSDADLALANIGPEDISEGVCEPLNAERQREDRGMKDSKSANPTDNSSPLPANSKESQKAVRDVRLAKQVSMKKGKSSKALARGIFPGAFVTYGVGNKTEEGDEEPCALVVERRPKNMWAIKVPLGEFSHRYRTMAVPEETLEAVEVDPILIKVEQRQWHRQMCYFLNPYRLTPVGEPIVLLLETNRVTGAALYKLLSNQVGVSPRVPSAGEELLPDELDSSKKIMKFFGFKLIVLSQTGGTCYRCPWYKSCKGCPILPNGDLISLQNLEPGTSIAMDWGMASTTKHQRLALSFELADTHESVEKVQQEENREMPLSDLIENFSSSERLEGMNQVHCARCKSHQDHSKTIKLWRTPPVLIVHLKRFQHSSWRRKKMTNLVRFPMNDLDFSPYIAESMPDRPSMRLPPKKPKGEEKETPNEDSPPTGKKSAPKPARRTTKMLKKEREKEEAAAFEAQHLAEVQKLMDSDYVGLRAFGGHNHGGVPPMYDLYGVVNHAGSLQGGHYIASVKRDQSHWQKFDDRSVSMINSKNVVSSQAYLLFYVRKDVQEADVSEVFPTKEVPLKEVRHRLQEVHSPLKTVVAERLQDRCSIM